MKKFALIALFLFLGWGLLGSCAHTNPNHQTKILQRSSFLKIEKTIIIKSCTSDSTCSQRKLRSAASGAVVKSTFSGGYVLTAAHVCDDTDIVERIKAAEPGVDVDTTFVVVALDGDKYSVEIIDMDFENDMCMLWVNNLYEPPLLIAPAAPVPGERIYNMAAPLGVHSKNMVPIFSGFYNGIDYRNIAIYSLPAFGGSSGSPIVNVKGELVGMVHSTLRFFPQITLSPNYKSLRTFINKSIQQDSYSRIVNVFLNVIFR